MAFISEANSKCTSKIRHFENKFGLNSNSNEQAQKCRTLAIYVTIYDGKNLTGLDKEPPVDTSDSPSVTAKECCELKPWSGCK